MCIERSAAKEHTREIFKLFKEQLNQVAALIVILHDNMHTTVNYDVSTHRQHYRKWKVYCDRNGKLLRCSCCHFEQYGIPCSHIIAVMKYEHMDSIPTSLICRRWTINAKSIDSVASGTIAEDGNKLVRLRYATLVASANQLCHAGSQIDAAFQDVRQSICNLIAKHEGSGGIGPTISQSHMAKASVIVDDPVATRTKGSLKKARKRKRCGKCRAYGHNKWQCPNVTSNVISERCVSSSDSDEDGGSPGGIIVEEV